MCKPCAVYRLVCVDQDAFSTNEQISFLGLQGGQAFFSAVKEGDLVVFATNDEQDRNLWVQAMYRATGQSYKPVPPAQNQQQNCRGANIQKDTPASLLSRLRPRQSERCLFYNASHSRLLSNSLLRLIKLYVLKVLLTFVQIFQ